MRKRLIRPRLEILSLKFVAVDFSICSDARRRNSRFLHSLRFGRNDKLSQLIRDRAQEDIWNSRQTGERGFLFGTLSFCKWWNGGLG
jgi:hypothetical protein